MGAARPLDAKDKALLTLLQEDARQGLASLAQEDPDAAGDLKELIGEAIDIVVGLVHTDLGHGRRGRKVEDVIAVDKFDELKKEYVIHHIPG